MSDYSPITDKDIKQMLNKLNKNNLDDLFNIIPENFKFNLEDIELNNGVTEFQAENIMNALSNKNLNLANSVCFMGGGAYDHYIPKIVDTLTGRSEFYTAYTPYQPEVSQGTLQYLYEFQSMICELSGMEISNASLYDGASSVAEACSMAIAVTKGKQVLVSKNLHPSYQELINIYYNTRDIDVVYINSNNGVTCINDLKNKMNKDVACVVIQSPNYNGILEDWSEISKYKQKSLLIAVSDPISLSLIKSPGDSNCDVFVGEGQSLGNYLSFGGPYIGLFATKMKYARKMPGRIIGRTKDVDGRDGFVMTLQTREQHIRRERATSNICTNQGLLALRSTIYMALMGKEGIYNVANISFQNTNYALNKIKELNTCKLKYNAEECIKEFVVELKQSATKIQKIASDNNILIDRPKNDESDKLILLAFTEKRTKEEIDSLISFLSNI